MKNACIASTPVHHAIDRPAPADIKVYIDFHTYIHRRTYGTPVLASTLHAARGPSPAGLPPPTRFVNYGFRGLGGVCRCSRLNALARHLFWAV